MPHSPADLYCANCGRPVGTAPTCAACGAENEFLDVPRPAGGHPFDEEHLWTPKAIEEALRAQGTAPPPPPPPAGSEPQPADAEPAADVSAFFVPPGTPDPSSSPVDERPPVPDAAPHAEPPEVSAFFAPLPGSDPQAPIESSSPPPGRVADPTADETGAPIDDQTLMLEDDEDDGPGTDDDERTLLLDEDSPPPIVAWLVRVSPPQTGREYPIRPGQTSIGTDGTDILLERKVDRHVSRRHAAISCREATGDLELTVCDIGSSNGTFVGEERVEGPTPLPPEAILRLGNVEFRLRAEDR